LAPVTVGTSVAYSEEYAMHGPNNGLLSRLASETGGRVVSSADDMEAPSALLRREHGPSRAGNEAWRWFFLAAILLFFADVAARRLAAVRELLDRALARLRSLRGTSVLSSADLAGLVARAREEERAKMKSRLSGIAREGKVDPELAAYLYIARMRSSRASKEEPRS
ncbi:MAG TPA: hypothetical protein VL354_11795, partial [Spirochaetia bacterium]|nr:hypothetical protein [Spirochaetia bacterium]